MKVSLAVESSVYAETVTTTLGRQLVKTKNWASNIESYLIGKFYQEPNELSVCMALDRQLDAQSEWYSQCISIVGNPLANNRAIFLLHDTLSS